MRNSVINVPSPIELTVAELPLFHLAVAIHLSQHRKRPIERINLSFGMLVERAFDLMTEASRPVPYNLDYKMYFVFDNK
jgi:hypothetical protein